MSLPLWETEPDVDYWTDRKSGLLCFAQRHSETGHWCGYVSLPKTHPWYRKDMEVLPDIELHGGVTYAGEMILHSESPLLSLFSKRLSEWDEQHWMVGFSCAHAGDFSPIMARLGLKQPNSRVYRDLKYVKKECKKLAKQVDAAWMRK